jgi:acetolactate synthase I/III small subunit
MTTHTLSVLVENKPGVLAHVAGLFSRRAFNIASLAVGPTHDERVSRMTIVVDGASTSVDQVRKQLEKLVRVLKVVELEDAAAIERELALIKVRVEPALRGQLLEVAGVFSANVVDMSPATLVLEAVASPAKLDALLAMLDTYGTCELVRTGRIGLARGASVITDEPAAPALDSTADRQAEAAA